MSSRVIACSVCGTKHTEMSNKSRCEKKCRTYGGRVMKHDRFFKQACQSSMEECGNLTKTAHYIETLKAAEDATNVQINNNTTNNNSHNTTTTNNNQQLNVTIINNFNGTSIPEWFQKYVDVKSKNLANLDSIFALLAKNNVDTEEKVLNHLQTNAFTLKEVRDKIVSDEDMSHFYAITLKNCKNDKEYGGIKVLWIVFEQIFLHIDADATINLSDLSKRPIRLPKRGVICEVMERDQRTEHVTWAKKHWGVLIRELLFKLACQVNLSLPNYYKRFGSLAQSGDHKDNPKHFTLDHKKYEKHPFHMWRKNIREVSDMEHDSATGKLVSKITTKLVEDCKHDMVAGWHLLIEYNMKAQAGCHLTSAQTDEWLEMEDARIIRDDPDASVEDKASATEVIRSYMDKYGNLDNQGRHEREEALAEMQPIQ